jgi:hypothetical protein
MSALPNRQRAIASGIIAHIMRDFLQKLDLDYYRSALLHIARTELERLLQERSGGNDLGKRSKLPFVASPTAKRSTSPEVTTARLPFSGPGEVRRE